MEELFSYSTWIAYWNSFIAWLYDNVFVIDNAVQLGVSGLALLIALLVARRAGPWLSARHADNGLQRVVRIIAPLLMPMIWFLIQWLSVSAASTMGWPNRVLASIAGLIAAWIVIRLATQIVKHPLLATVIAWVAWTIAALNILNLLDPVMQILDSAGMNIGEIRISLLTIAQSTIALAVLITTAVYLTGALDARINSSRSLSPSLQVLFSKSLKIVLIGLAIIIALQVVGIDLTALAVFGGAIGLGVGFGLQKIVSNLISGVILLLDKSIKPGDVIAVGGTYGWVTSLGGRYISVVTRDGVEHLIPNETLISERVENWTHTNNRTRLRIDFGVHYRSDVHDVIRVCLEAAKETPRVLDSPEPKCLLIEFGDNSVNFQLRVWIADAQNGVQNVKSAVMLSLWDKFKEHDIEIPYPQRDVHLYPVSETEPDEPGPNQKDATSE